MTIYNVQDLIAQKFSQIAQRMSNKTNLPQNFKEIFAQSFENAIQTTNVESNIPISGASLQVSNIRIQNSYNLKSSSYSFRNSINNLSKDDIILIATQKAKQYGVLPSLVLSVIEAESGFAKMQSLRLAQLVLCSLCLKPQNLLV